MHFTRRSAVLAFALVCAGSMVLLPDPGSAAPRARRAGATQQAAPKPPPGPPPRAAFTEREQAAAVIPGIPDARFWADSVEEYQRVLGPSNGPWLALSAGGEDSAFGAGS